jgi:hypothetical protein
MNFVSRKGQDFRTASGHQTVEPKMSVVDVVVFDRPVDMAKELTLTLRASNIDGTGQFKFRINLAAWR